MAFFCYLYDIDARAPCRLGRFWLKNFGLSDLCCSLGPALQANLCSTRVLICLAPGILLEPFLYGISLLHLFRFDFLGKDRHY